MFHKQSKALDADSGRARLDEEQHSAMLPQIIKINIKAGLMFQWQEARHPQVKVQISRPANENFAVLKHLSLNDNRTGNTIPSAPLFL